MVKTIGNVQKDAQVRAVASGTLSNGDTVIVNSDGTVSAISGNDASFGSGVVYESARARYQDSTFDTDNNKVVVVYQEGDTTAYGYAAVGTVSGTSITFGTPVVFNSGNTQYPSCTYTSSSKIVVCYRDGGASNVGKAIVGTISGNSISFGTEDTFESGSTFYTSVAYDPVADRVVVNYSDGGNSFYGTAAVGTISGTSISFAFPVVYKSASSEYQDIVYDPDSGNLILFFRDSAASYNGKGIVGTVSGNSISFGTAIQFDTTGNCTNIRATYDEVNNKVVVGYYIGAVTTGYAVVGTVSGTSISFGTPVVFANANIGTSWTLDVTSDNNAGKILFSYMNSDNSYYGTSVVGTVSGTSISFGSDIIFNNTGRTEMITSTFDSNSNKIVVFYEDGGSTNDGTAKVFSSPSTNLTSDNFIGFADGAYADTQSAVINTTCSVARNQTSLTAGQKYYVLTTGALSETAGNPSVEAGTAISSTEILVKG